MKKIQFVSYLAVFLPAAVLAQQLSPKEIVNSIVVAEQTLNFSDVSPYVHTGVLKRYREVTSLIIKHAQEKYGADAIVKFLQGATPEELESLSDREYWALMMAASLQFTSEKPLQTVQPVSEFVDVGQFFLVYPGTIRPMMAPEAGVFLKYDVLGFRQEEGSWKLNTLLAGWLETSLYQFEKSLREKPSQ